VPTVSRFASSNAVVTTGWSNPTRAYADDTSYATAVPARNATISSDYGFANFSTLDIPDGSTIASVTLSARVFCSANTPNATQAIQGRVSGANSGSAATRTGSRTEATITATLVGVTLANLRAASTAIKARVSASRTGSTRLTSSLDWVNITIVYSLPVPASATGSVVATGGGVLWWSYVKVETAGPESHEGYFTATGGGIVTEVGSKETTGSVSASGGGVMAVSWSSERNVSIAPSGGGTISWAYSAKAPWGFFTATGGGAAAMGAVTDHLVPLALSGGGGISVGGSSQHRGSFTATGGGGFATLSGSPGGRSDHDQWARYRLRLMGYFYPDARQHPDIRRKW
jgi:hypothetical protein